jgi:hypothetical protein
MPADANGKSYGTSAIKGNGYSDMELMTALTHFQHDVLDLCGTLVEIGVYQGWFVGALASAAAPGEVTVAIDIFDAQDQNTDGSGALLKNLRARFWRRIKAFDFEHGAVTTIQGSSMGMTHATLAARNLPAARIFSVDGGHTSTICFNDMRIAACSLAEGGVMIIDDYANNGWTDVRKAVGNFLALFPGAFIPFAATKAKLYLCAPEFHDRYMNYLLQLPWDQSEEKDGSTIDLTFDVRTGFRSEKNVIQDARTFRYIFVNQSGLMKWP